MLGSKPGGYCSYAIDKLTSNCPVVHSVVHLKRSRFDAEMYLEIKFSLLSSTSHFEAFTWQW